MGAEGWITCHYLDPFGVMQTMTLLSTEPFQHAVRHQEEIRAALEQLCATLGYEVLSVQLVVVGANQLKISRPVGERQTNVLDFPVRRGSSVE